MTTLDVHGMTVLEAKTAIERFIASQPASVTEIVIIHGYSHGDALKNMVRDRHTIRSKRIVRKRFTMNQGETIIELK